MQTDRLRNVALLGHGASGKTTFTEALLFAAGNTTRMGKVEDGSTLSDFDAEEKRRGQSLNLSVIPVEWKDYKINLLDTPGFPDFAGEMQSTIRVADLGLDLRRRRRRHRGRHRTGHAGRRRRPRLRAR